MFELGAFPSHRGELRASILSQRVGLVDVRGSRDPFLVAVAGEFVGVIVYLDRVREQRDSGVVAAQTKILTRQLGLQRQRDSSGVRFAALRLRARGSGRIAEPTEQIDFPVQV